MGNQAKQMIESIYEENLSILNLERIYYDTISKVTPKKIMKIKEYYREHCYSRFTKKT